MFGRSLISNTLVPQNREFPFQRFSSPNYPQEYNVLRRETSKNHNSKHGEKQLEQKKEKPSQNVKEIDIAEKFTTN